MTTRLAVFAGLCAWSMGAFADDPIPHLPKPHYDRQQSDPQWLVDVVQFHGHLGPAVVAGARVGMAGLRAVEADGYFDVEVNCEGPMANPPQSCFLDGLQVGTGSTMGKRLLRWTEGPQVVVHFKNRKTGKTAALSMTPALMKLLPAFSDKATSEKAHDPGEASHASQDHLEAASRKIAAMPEKELVVVKSPSSGK